MAPASRPSTRFSFWLNVSANIILGIIFFAGLTAGGSYILKIFRLHIERREEAGIFAFDDSRFLNKYEEYTVNDEVYLEFYTALQNMIASPAFDFDIITHFDLPKKFDKRVEDKTLVMDKAIETLELAKKSDLTIEINTSGLRKQAKEQYPSEDIIKEMYALDIPILLGSDAHNPEEIAFKFKETTALVKSVGYNQLAHFKERKRSFIDI